MDVIVNEFEEPVVDKTIQKLGEHPALVNEIKLDSLLVDDLAVCEEAVRNCMSVTQVTNLAVALAVRHIVVNQLYLTEFPTHSQYFEQSSSRLQMTKAQASRFLNAGLAYHEYRYRLEEAGFKPEGSFYKLPFLIKAADRHGVTAAIQAICSMTTDGFREYAAGKKKLPVNFTSLDLDVSLSKKGIAVQGKDVIKVADVKKIVDSGSEPYLVGLDSPGEKAAINNFLKKHRSKK